MARERRDRGDRDSRDQGMVDFVVKIRRSRPVVKGGRRFSFNALVVVGDKQGKVSLRLRQGQRSAARRREGDQGRRGDRPTRPKKVSAARRHHPAPRHRPVRRQQGHHGPGRPGHRRQGRPRRPRRARRRPASRNILTKVHGSTNPINLVKATIDGPAAAADPRGSGPAAGSDPLMDLTQLFTTASTSGSSRSASAAASAPGTARPPAAATRASTPAPAPSMPGSLFEGGQMPLLPPHPQARLQPRAPGTRTSHVVNVGDLDDTFDDGATVDAGRAEGKPASPTAPATASASSATAS